MSISSASTANINSFPYETKTVIRPWGWYREYARNIQCTVWFVEMKPGECGSLQMHAGFDELWIFLTDGAEVQIGDEIHNPSAGDEIFIPRRTRHRLSNLRGKYPVRMFEVAFGTVSDDDKVRYEDKYGRC